MPPHNSAHFLPSLRLAHGRQLFFYCLNPAAPGPPARLTASRFGFRYVMAKKPTTSSPPLTECDCLVAQTRPIICFFWRWECFSLKSAKRNGREATNFADNTPGFRGPSIRDRELWENSIAVVEACEERRRLRGCQRLSLWRRPRRWHSDGRWRQRREGGRKLRKGGCVVQFR